LALILILSAGAGTKAAERPAQEFGLPTAAPEDVGFSSERLKRLDAVIQQTIDQNDFPGVVAVAARHGKIFYSKTFGWQDIGARTPMPQNAIFRMYSQTKPIIGVAMMILYEEGKWSAQDPIAKHIPEFAGLKVFTGFDPNHKPLVEEPVHAPMMRELMTHTAGFGSGSVTTPEDTLYLDANGQNFILGAPTLEEMIHRLAHTPLTYQPGSQWVYSVSVDIQGYLIEKLSGQKLPDFLKKRIFDPLGMKDTGFYIPTEKLTRLARQYYRTDAGELKPSPELLFGLGPFDRPPTRPSGGGGMLSTAHDYFRFAEMLRRGGELDGARILGPATIQMMSANHLAPGLMTGQWGGGIHRMRPGLGFRFDFAVYTDPGLADETTGKGTYLWLGAAGTCFWVDPTYDVVFVGMVQRQSSDERPNLEALTRQTLYQALVRPDR